MKVTHPADLREALTVTPVVSRPGMYRGNLDRSWSYVVPSGGVLMSLALAAMREELKRLNLEYLVPASATATFCSSVAEGAIDIEVTVLRSGRTATQMRAHLHPRGEDAQPGDIGLEVAATFILRREDSPVVDMTLLPYPHELPTLEASEFYDVQKRGVPLSHFYRNYDFWNAKGSAWWEPQWEAGGPHVARYFRYQVPPLLPSGRLDPLCLPPIADTMASAVHEAAGARNPPLIFPSLDLTLHFITADAGDPETPILVDTRANAVFSSAASATVSLWQGKTLLMTGTQTMTLRTLKAR